LRQPPIFGERRGTPTGRRATLLVVHEPERPPTGAPMWEGFAEDYLVHAPESAYNAYYDRPAVLEALGSVEGLRVLDAGCGPGLYSAELVAGGAGYVLGVDASPEMIRLATETVQGPVEFRVHDLAEPLRWLDDRSFDAAVMALVIHHLDDRVAALREISRVLRPGGRLVVSTHHPTGDWIRQGASLPALPRGRRQALPRTGLHPLPAHQTLIPGHDPSASTGRAPGETVSPSR